MTLRKRQNLRLQSKLSYCLVRKISSKGLNAKNCRFPSSWYLQHRQRERVHYNWSKSWRWQPHPCVRIGSAEIFYHNDCFLSKRNYGSPFVYGISWNQAKTLERPLVERQLFCREYWLCKQRKHYSLYRATMLAKSTKLLLTVIGHRLVVNLIPVRLQQTFWMIINIRLVLLVLTTDSH